MRNTWKWQLATPPGPLELQMPAFTPVPAEKEFSGNEMKIIYLITQYMLLMMRSISISHPISHSPLLHADSLTDIPRISKKKDAITFHKFAIG